MRKIEFFQCVTLAVIGGFCFDPDSGKILNVVSTKSIGIALIGTCFVYTIFFATRAIVEALKK